MSGPPPVGFTPPNFRVPRLLGIFNVLFSVQILICGLCLGGYTLTLPAISRGLGQLQKQVEKKAESDRKAQLDEVVEREKTAKTEQEKVEAAARRMEIENRPKATLPGTVDFTKMGIGDPQFINWTWVELLSGIVLNLMMLISGIGLLHWKPWARSLGIWTALLKIARLVLVYGFFVLTIVPPLARRMGAAVSEMMANQPGMRPPGGGSPDAFFARIYTVYYSALGLGMILFGVVYPLILLWLLTRPSVKSACSGRLKLPAEPNQPW